MSHREDLLDGAKRCLLDRGWARVTARDLVTASGTNLASIGYHYGSKEALMTEALIALTDDWGAAVETAMGGADELGFAATWDRMLGVFTAYRGLWSSTFEALADGSPAVRERLVPMQDVAHVELARLFGAPEEAGAVLQALLLGAMSQQLVDPDGAPGGAQLEAAFKSLGVAEPAPQTRARPETPPPA